MAKLTVNELDLQGERVLTRVDYNVPMAESDGVMVINDDTRIRATLPTLKTMIEKGAKVILCAHLGRPKGERVDSMSLRPVAQKLSELINQPVAFCDQCVGDKVTD
ncbi:MAG: phosphoglycerate kinase, partial [Verrucomicrobiota bacterium]|nr:phosphoglycerate kinase [Verrucomicrobiota bacterium]